MSASGQTVLDLGPFPGVSDAEFTLTGLTGIADDSEVEAWIQPAATVAGWQSDGVTLNGFLGGLERGANLNGIVASKQGILSMWIRPENYAVNIFANNLIAVDGELVVTLAQPISLTARGASGVDVNLSGVVQRVKRWIHLLFAWDIAANVGSFYSDDVLIDSAINRTADEAIDYTAAANWSVGAPVLGQGLSGAIAEFYFAPGQYLDMSVTSNRRKFISAALQPVDLGSTGSTPTGTAPIVYLRLDGSQVATAFKTNRGTGGDFSGGIVQLGMAPSFLVHPGHSVDEHICDGPKVIAHTPSAAGASMKIRVTSQDGPPILDTVQNKGQAYPGGATNNEPRICGKWNVGWGWN